MWTLHTFTAMEVQVFVEGLHYQHNLSIGKMAIWLENCQSFPFYKLSTLFG
jgi:thiamine biosynthesis protein ThiC